MWSTKEVAQVRKQNENKKRNSSHARKKTRNKNHKNIEDENLKNAE